MAKLKLKETPFERAEKERKREQKEARRAAKRAFRRDSQEDFDTQRSSKRYRRVDSSDEEYGPQPAQAGPSSYHRYRQTTPDEERRFREKMMDAMEDDYRYDNNQRLEGLSTHMNSYAHVPKRWRGIDDPYTLLADFGLDGSSGVGGGSGRAAGIGLETWQLNDDEYAEYIKAGMYLYVPPHPRPAPSFLYPMNMHFPPPPPTFVSNPSTPVLAAPVFAFPPPPFAAVPGPPVIPCVPAVEHNVSYERVVNWPSPSDLPYWAHREFPTYIYGPSSMRNRHSSHSSDSKRARSPANSNPSITPENTFHFHPHSHPSPPVWLDASHSCSHCSRKHRSELEEKARRWAEKEKEREKQRVQRKEMERQTMEYERKRAAKKVAKAKERTERSRRDYDEKWDELLSHHSSKSADDAEKGGKSLSFDDIPWPIMQREDRELLPEDFVEPRISEFLLAIPADAGSSAPSERDIFRSTLLRFHPDKFQSRILARVVEKDRERAKEAANAVVRAVNNLLKNIGKS